MAMKLPMFLSDSVKIDAQDLSYSIDINKVRKVILSNISIELLPGQLCALMGPSGAGKSTLLDLLADRKLDGYWSGDILFNGGGRSKWFNRESAYILQDDNLIKSLTVEETVYYSAKVRMNEGTSENQVKERVNLLLEWMGLTHIRTSTVGGELNKGISGGQRKRLSIAVEIVALPSMIFFDEPTSGLDSSIALEIMTVVRNLANQNRTCVSTIHQPSPEVFAMFDTVALLAAGRLIYFGPVSQTVPYFTHPDRGFVYDGNQNAAEFIIEIGEGLLKPFQKGSPLHPIDLEERYKKSEIFEQLRNKLNSGQSWNLSALQPKFARLHATTKRTQFKVLMRRSWVAAIRDTDEQRSQLLKNIIVGLLIGMVFYKQGHADEPLFENGIPTASVQNVSSLLFFGLLFQLISNAQAIPLLCSQNVLYRRELAAYAYSASPYWLSQLLVIIPMLLVNQLIFNVIIFFLCDFPNDPMYFVYFSSLTFLGNLSSYYYATFLAAFFNSEEIAFALFPISFLVLATFAGFPINLEDVPVFWSWLPWIDFARWAFEGYMVNQWERFDDDDYPGTPNGNGDVLSLYGFDGFDKWNSFWILGTNIGVVALMTYIAMRPPTKHLKYELDTNKAIYSLIRPEDIDVNNETTIPTVEEGLLNPVQSLAESIPSSTGNHDESDMEWFRSNVGDDANIHSDGCRLTFRDIHYSVEVRRKDGEKQSLQILKGVSGVTRSGEMMALMGASGAGKSTLLDILADRKSTGETIGTILVNGKPRNAQVMRASAYVMQEDVHNGTLSVRQTLYFAAQLRLNESFSTDFKQRRINSILNMLGLLKIAESRVGTAAKRGISGGQLKRLSIGVEIMHLPNLIFLDEPTTGLDSAIAYEVMSTVRSLANRNRTIISTIHQPSPLVYQLFDTLLLLAEGRVLYFGPAANVTTFFSQSPFQFPYKEGSNPADFAIAVAGSFLLASDGGKVRADELSGYFDSTDLHNDLYAALHEHDVSVSEEAVLLGNSQVKSVQLHFCTSTFNQIKVLLHREFSSARLDPTEVLGGVFRHIFVAVFYGTVYYQLKGGTDPTAYSNRISLLYFALTFALAGQQDKIPPLQDIRPLFYRERGSRATNTLAFWTSKVIFALPQAVFNVFIFCAILYYLVGLNNAPGAFEFFYYIMLITDVLSLLTCYIVSGLAANTQSAMNFFPVSLFFATAFAGYAVYLPKFPYWLGSWAPYITYLRYSFQALTLNEFEGNSNLPDEEIYIDMLGFDDLSKEECAPILFIFLGFYIPACLMIFYFCNFEKR